MDESQADDLFQNFFLSLVCNPPSPEVKNIKGYLYRAIINDIIDNARQIERYQRRVHSYAEYLQCCISEESPENTMVDAEEINKMLKCIEKKLRYDEARAINLRYKNGYKLKEVATAMGMNNTAAWRCISKGLSEIRQFLGKSYLQ